MAALLSGPARIAEECRPDDVMAGTSPLGIPALDLGIAGAAGHQRRTPIGTVRG
jgi:hypothetical protein